MRDHVRRCTWERDDEGNWDTGCGERFCLNDGTPSENSMRFCCYCGGKLRDAYGSPYDSSWETLGIEPWHQGDFLQGAPAHSGGDSVTGGSSPT